jgi:crotonobetainyl-CoA:carnitine CoA-transferase CaiB-like acyl-CoA transferase
MTPSVGSSKDKLPLDGIKIIDLSRMLPGPYCSMILADLGADVIRVEDPSFPYSNPPPLYTEGNYIESAFNSILMRNKRSLSLNLKKKGALDIFYKLVETADVIIESFRPKVAEKLSIDFPTLQRINEKIIYCALTGYGQTGPYALLPGHDMNYMSYAGSLSLNRNKPYASRIETNKIPDNPVVPCIQSADLGGSLYAAIAILAAIRQRDLSQDKKGQYIDISMMDCAFALNPMEASYVFSKNPEANPLHGDFPFYAIYRTKDDKFLSLGAIESQFWYDFCDVFEIPDLKSKQFTHGEEKEEISKIIEIKFLSKTQQEWLDIFKNIDIPLTPVLDFQEACSDPQIKSRNMVVNLNHPKLGSVQNISNPINYSKTPLKIRNNAPLVGENTTDILTEAGFTEDQIKEYKKLGCFR